MKKNTTLFILVFLVLTQIAFAQNVDSTKPVSHFSGVITATNNGVSLLPNFTLGRPALLFDLSVGKGKLSFDPMFRFAMDGKPWGFIFWFHYKLISTPKLSMSVGAHPSFVFKNTPVITNGVTSNNFTVQRYFAAEITPTYSLRKNMAIGIHYLASHGLDKNGIQYTHFIAVKAVLSNIKLVKDYSLTLIPQSYYLKMDKNEGTYVNGIIVLSKKKLPFTISSIMSKSINTEIAGKDFVWNVAINYNFNKKYVRQ